LLRYARNDGGFWDCFAALAMTELPRHYEGTKWPRQSTGISEGIASPDFIGLAMTEKKARNDGEKW